MNLFLPFQPTGKVIVSLERRGGERRGERAGDEMSLVSPPALPALEGTFKV